MRCKAANRKLGGIPPQIAADRHYSTRRAELGANYQPRQFTPRARHRFEVARRRAYLDRIDGRPSPWQASTIVTLISLEWAALDAEHRLGDLQAAREAREHRRLFQRLLADFERSIQPPAAERPDPLDAIRELMSQRHRESAT